MKCWYREREIKHILNLFKRAVAANDPLNAGALYGCLFDMLQTANIYVQDRQHNYKWKRVITFLHKELDAIQVEAKDYPITVQQAIVAKAIFYQEARKKT